MLTPLSEAAEKAIIRNINKVLSTGDIEHLSKKGYNYLCQCPGFIAHYNLHGFKDEYRDTEKLRQHLVDNRQSNRWDNFRPGDENHEYHMQRKRIYNALDIFGEQAKSPALKRYMVALAYRNVVEVEACNRKEAGELAQWDWEGAEQTNNCVLFEIKGAA